MECGGLAAAFDTDQSRRVHYRLPSSRIVACQIDSREKLIAVARR
jgi:hypothetical protein